MRIKVILLLWVIFLTCYLILFGLFYCFLNNYIVEHDIEKILSEGLIQNEQTR